MKGCTFPLLKITMKQNTKKGGSSRTVSLD